MEKIEKQFDKLVKFSQRSVKGQYFFALLVFGFISMAGSLIAEYLFPTKEIHSAGIGGIFFAYISICLFILAGEKGSRTGKVLSIIVLPFIIFFAAQIYAY